MPLTRGSLVVVALVFLTGCQSSGPQRPEAKSGTLTETAAGASPTPVAAPPADSPIPPPETRPPASPAPVAAAKAPIESHARPEREAPLRRSDPPPPALAVAPIPPVTMVPRETPSAPVQTAEVARRIPVPESAAPVVLRPPAETPAPPPATTPRPPTPPAPTPYSGPKSGVLTWSGQIEKGGTVTLDGKLPGVPVMVDIDTKEFAIVEAPSPGNGWNRVVVRSKNKRHTVITVGWSVL